ncbi:hypothetical protein J3Q64DRAFT_1717031 [Phycomyces blakesleeanus]|uniref:SWI5-dependent HO expression protein 3 n=2 Tax=Phycomyces blakesleeanus TaxID=4837 RepID=A0A167QPS2_PHYB8|nr:hypothetical protein PHYBLDRAFT_179380 [Phycomyces blakesleeanus NRRL 1555(-)]OAD80030.1 hypothetical protein PHYBLDRAFT_179380 [Phycomyces blakesleeanus NRRL 1555(-)]|eukprot:XP_018298070.1 hypothetical protein PHYBLDRAFT_179380 [Phycomyces blakesleeanus NRRL 1555(-)]
MQVSHDNNVSRINYGHLFRYDQMNPRQSSKHDLNQTAKVQSGKQLTADSIEPEESRSARTKGMVSVLKSKHEVLTRQRDAMALEVKTTAETRDMHLASQSVFRAENDTLRLEMNRLAMEIDAKQTAIDSLKTTADDQKTYASSVQLAAETQRMGTAELKKKAGEYKQAISRAKLKAAQAQAQTQALKDSLKGLSGQRRHEKLAHEQLLSLLSTLKKEGQESIERLQQGGHELKSLGDERSSLLESTRDVVKNIESWHDKNKTAFKTEVVKLGEALSPCTDKDKELKDSVEQCKNQMDSLVDRIRKTQQ